MSYDFDCSDRNPPLREPTPVLTWSESLLFVLELSAIYLTGAPTDSFTIDQLLATAQDFVGFPVHSDPALSLLASSEIMEELPNGAWRLR